MKNLLEETIEDISENDLSTNDIIYIGTDPTRYGPYYSCDWETYQNIADFEYDNGYGGNEIPLDLIILFRDGSFMERNEYDGSEWWSVRRPIAIPQDTLPLNNLGGGIRNTGDVQES